MNKRLVLFIRAVLFVGLVFVTGWTASLWANNNGINSGLVSALNSVGKNLFGDAAFAVTEVVVDDGNGGIPTIQIDLIDQPPDPIRINVFRSDSVSCETYAQFRIDSTGLSAYYDSEAAPGGSINLSDVDLSSQPPDPCHLANVSPG